MSALMVVHAGVLLALDRLLACDCALWESVGDPAVNSQAAIDPYSLLHAASGAVIAVLLLRYRPHWSYWRVMLIVLFCSTVWEVIENLPLSSQPSATSPAIRCDTPGTAC